MIPPESQPAPARLLVVDDDENNRDMLSRRLQRSGYNVAMAEDGMRALAAIAAEPFDLVLLDIEMPGMNGFQVLTEIRKTTPATKLPVIIATARGDRSDIVEALALGANDFVSKPLDYPVVFARVQTQLSLKQSVDRIVALEEDVRRRNAELERINIRMKQDLELASRMQQSLLPSGPVQVNGLSAAWMYRPCDELGGDIFNIFPLSGDHVGMYLLDVSGHGVPAALLSVTLSRILTPVKDQSSLLEKRGGNGLEPREPAAVAEELNRRFMMTSEHTQYFTIFYGLLHLPTRRLRYISAGHPPAVHVPGGASPQLLPGRGFGVGWFDDTEFDQYELELRPSDRIILYSDGLTEAMDAKSEQFANDRLLAACGRSDHANLDQSLASLIDQVDQFRGTEPMCDDLSALAIEIATA